jgi:predicted ArsR family transcriptional regulator
MEGAKPKLKRRILHLLKMQGAQTATVLAAALGVSPMAIRQHLQSLRANGWLTYQEERRALGRPVKLWQLTDQAIESFPDSHADLLVDLLKEIEATFGTGSTELLLDERSRRQIQTYRESLEHSAPTTWQQQVNAIAQLRSQEGYMAEVISQPGEGLLLVENHCPIRAAAQVCPALCHAELTVFRTVLGAQVSVERTEHVLQGDRRCAYLVRLQQAE